MPSSMKGREMAIRQAYEQWNVSKAALEKWLLIIEVQCCFTTTETIRSNSPRTATSTFTQLLSSVLSVQVQCCFTSTEAIRINKDGEPRTFTSTFTQLQVSDGL